jgi:ferritin-like metal-binding protein YciE
MNNGRQRIIEALNEAHTCEQAHEHVLQAQIAAAPRGRYRKGLQTHLRETRDHARRLEQRITDLRKRDNVFQLGVRLFENAVGQGLSLGRAPLNLLGKSPLDLLRGSGGPAKVLNDAKDACATEALEIARYRGIEGLAQSIGDRQTARLVSSIRADEEKMLDHLVEEIPSLVSWVMDADVRGKASPAITRRSGATGARSSTTKRRKVTSRSSASAKGAAREPRPAPAVTQPDGQQAGVTAPVADLPIADYQTLTAEEVVQRLAVLSLMDLAKIDAHERRHESRSPILSRISILRGEHPSAGEEVNVPETRTVPGTGDQEQPVPLRSYHDMGKTRESILAAAEKELTGA